ERVAETLKSSILQCIFRHVEADRCLVVLFGSRATGDARPTSDVDLAISCSPPLSTDTWARLRRVLNEDLPTLRKVDLVNLDRLEDTALVQQILKEGRIWHRGKHYRGKFTFLDVR
ncbi:MAG: nucleotidyltransferase domain-containing protein, partial [Candidatus Hydrothermae bacterium]|nr:nucleotidyltransferase domain-containing protein [Candidatus Hydrothermae bacterium]